MNQDKETIESVYPTDYEQHNSKAMAIESYSRGGGDFLQKHVEYSKDQNVVEIQPIIGQLKHGLAVQSKKAVSNFTSEYLHSDVLVRDAPTKKNRRTPPKNNTLKQLIPACSQPARILVADDNLLVRTCLMNLLDRWGMSYKLCDNGLSAWQALQEHEFDLLLIDLQMPGMDGHQLVAQLRNTPTNANAHLPIVALAGTDNINAKAQMFEAGTNAFLAKPFCPQELNKTMLRFLGLSSNQKNSLLSEPIDEHLLFELYEDDYEHRYLMFDIFLRNTPSALATISHAVSTDNVSLLKREVHKVKPTFAMVGLQKAGLLAESIEDQLQETGQLSLRLRKEVGHFKQSVQKALELVRVEQQSIAKSLK